MKALSLPQFFGLIQPRTSREAVEQCVRLSRNEALDLESSCKWLIIALANRRGAFAGTHVEKRASNATTRSKIMSKASRLAIEQI
jgi:hypothetical protein